MAHTRKHAHEMGRKIGHFVLHNHGREYFDKFAEAYHGSGVSGGGKTTEQLHNYIHDLNIQDPSAEGIAARKSIYDDAIVQLKKLKPTGKRFQQRLWETISAVASVTQLALSVADSALGIPPGTTGTIASLATIPTAAAAYAAREAINTRGHADARKAILQQTRHDLDHVHTSHRESALDAADERAVEGDRVANRILSALRLRHVDR
jgi:hypothetical protein